MKNWQKFLGLRHLRLKNLQRFRLLLWWLVFKGLVKQPLLVNWLINWLKNKKLVQWWLLQISIVQQPLISWKLWDNKSMFLFLIWEQRHQQLRLSKMVWNKRVPIRMTMSWLIRLVVCRLTRLSCKSCMILRILLIQTKFSWLWIAWLVRKLLTLPRSSTNS